MTSNTRAQKVLQEAIAGSTFGPDHLILAKRPRSDLPPELLQSPGLSEPVNLTGSARCRRYERKQRRSGLLFTDTWLICTIPNSVIDQEGRNIYRADNDATLAY